MPSRIYEECPGNVHPGLQNYYEYGIEPGDFLGTVLRNDLRGACMAADDYNQRMLWHIVGWLYNYAPMGSWGSDDNYLKWLQSGGFEGQKKVVEAEGAEG